MVPSNAACSVEDRQMTKVFAQHPGVSIFTALAAIRDEGIHGLSHPACTHTFVFVDNECVINVHI